jgi:hypothetical protein
MEVGSLGPSIQPPMGATRTRGRGLRPDPNAGPSWWPEAAILLDVGFNPFAEAEWPDCGEA